MTSLADLEALLPGKPGDWAVGPDDANTTISYFHRDEVGLVIEFDPAEWDGVKSRDHEQLEALGNIRITPTILRIVHNGQRLFSTLVHDVCTDDQGAYVPSKQVPVSQQVWDLCRMFSDSPEDFDRFTQDAGVDVDTSASLWPPSA